MVSVSLFRSEHLGTNKQAPYHTIQSSDKVRYIAFVKVDVTPFSMSVEQVVHSKRIASQIACTSCGYKSLCHCQWPLILPKTYHCQPHSEVLVSLTVCLPAICYSFVETSVLFCTSFLVVLYVIFNFDLLMSNFLISIFWRFHWTFAFCMLLDMYPVSFLYMLTYSYANTICWWCYLYFIVWF